MFADFIIKLSGAGYLAFLLTCFLPCTRANNLQLADVTIQDSHTLRFWISWENSWRIQDPPGNHDAVWVFAKAKQGSEWNHLDLNAGNIEGFQTGNPLLEIIVPEDGKGVFIRRKDISQGDIPWTWVEISLLEGFSLGEHSIDITGIEMVFIPPGPFWLGDGISLNSFSDGTQPGPFLVIDESAIEGPPNGLIVVNPNPGGPSYEAQNGIIEGFPKGTTGFYLMKYEISQEMYARFLNRIDLTAQTKRMTANPFSPAGTPALATGLTFRNSLVIQEPATGEIPALIACDGDGDGIPWETDDGMARALNFLSWGDLAAWLDWAALRPITELEFEKACRGPQFPVEGEFAWGSPWIVDANSIEFDGSPFEGVSDSIPVGYGMANHGYAGVQGPLRSGFAAGNSTTRLESGAGYYGCMELSGNVWEMVISAFPSPQVFQATLGDGFLGPEGEANIPDWPDPATGVGAGLRGGAWNSGIAPAGSFRDLASSDRFYAGLPPNQRRNTTGGRGAR